MNMPSIAAPVSSVVKPERLHWSRIRTSIRTIVLAVCAWMLLVLPGTATALMYDAGMLDFQSSGQSMWGEGTAYQMQGSSFVGTEWVDKTATIGDILGSAGSSSYWTDQWVPVPWFECRGFLCSDGVWHKGYNQPIWVPPTPDVRTGAELKVQSSGKVGLEFGYTIDSGSVDSTVGFSAQATLPDQVLRSDFFSLNPVSVLGSGSIVTQSPKIESYVSAIMQLSGSVDALACGLGNCASGSFKIPTVDLNQRIVSIDPNSVKFLDGVLPPNNEGEEWRPFAQIPIDNQYLTLQGGGTIVPPVVGYKLTDSSGDDLIPSSLPDTPSVTVDLAKLMVQVPDISTSGGLSGDRLASNGDDDLLSLMLDLDGAATIFAGLPPAGLNFTLIDALEIKLAGSLDLIDVDAGPVLGIAQNFELVPTLMVDLSFDKPVAIAGMIDPQSSWSGRWDLLPQLALLETTTLSPTFWIDTLFSNDLALELGLEGTLDVLKLTAKGSVGSVGLIDFGPLSLNNLLGLNNRLFETDTLDFSVYSNAFDLGGFNSVLGSPFTISAYDQIAPVPEPGTLFLLAAGLIGMFFIRRKMGL